MSGAEITQVINKGYSACIICVCLCDWVLVLMKSVSCQLHIPLRLLCGGLLFTCNAVMWTFFAKALRLSSSSAQATVTTTASNFISSVSTHPELQSDNQYLQSQLTK